MRDCGYEKLGVWEAVGVGGCGCERVGTKLPNSRSDKRTSLG